MRIVARVNRQWTVAFWTQAGDVVAYLSRLTSAWPADDDETGASVVVDVGYLDAFLAEEARFPCWPKVTHGNSRRRVAVSSRMQSVSWPPRCFLPR